MTMIDHKWRDLVMAWLSSDKRKCEHKVVRLVLEFDCLHFTQCIPMCPQCSGYKHTWYPPVVREWWETFIKLLLCNIIKNKWWKWCTMTN